MIVRSKKLYSLVLIFSLVLTPTFSYCLTWSGLFSQAQKTYLYLAHNVSKYFSQQSKSSLIKNIREKLATYTHLFFAQNNQDLQVNKSSEVVVNKDIKDQSDAKSRFNYDYVSWKQACKKLPSFIKIGSSYTHTALDWNEFDFALRTFFVVNKIWYLKNTISWVEKAPAQTSDFFNIDAQIFAPFVQKLVVSTDSVIAVRGDLHGDIHSLMAYLDFLQKQGYMHGFKIINTKFNLLFLGDYVDRGNYGAEVLYTLMRLKIANPDQVILVRGNHEDITICSHYGFADEIAAKFGDDVTHSRVQNIARLYDFLPVALYLGSGCGAHKDFLQCCHGGMEVGFNPHALLQINSSIAFQWIEHLNQQTEYAKLDILPDAPCQAKSYFRDFKVNNFNDIGFMWSDFHVPRDGMLCMYNPGRGFMYGKDMTRAILKQESRGTHKVRGVLRAHQHSACMNDMMASILDPKNETNHKGVSKLWKDESTGNRDLWDGIVCTFLVAPDGVYSNQGALFDFDAFALLKMADTFDQWKLTVHRNMLKDIISDYQNRR